MAPPSERTAVTVAFATGAPAGVVSRPTIAPSSAARAAAGSTVASTISATAGIHFVGSLIARVPRVHADPWPREGRVHDRAGGRVFAGRPKGVKKTTAPAPAVLPLPPSQLAVGTTTVTVREV